MELESLADHWGPKADTDKVSILCWKMLLARWVDLDPKRALKVETATEIYSLRGWCYRVWSERDPLAALAASKEKEDRGATLASIVGKVAKKHLPEALALIDAYPHHQGILRAIFSEWARVEPDKALARVETLSGTVRDEIRKTVLKALAAKSPEDVLAMVRESESPLITQRNQESEILDVMIKEDPLKAMPHVLAMSPCKKRYELMTKLARARAAIDPEGTLAWGKSLPPGSEQQAVIAAATSKLDFDLNELIALLDEIGWQNASTNLQDRVELRLSSGGSSGGGHKDSLSNQLQSALKNASNAQDIAAVMTALCLYRRDQPHALNSLAGHWLTEAPDLLQSVLTRLSDRPMVDKIVGQIAHTIQDKDSLHMIAEALETLEPAQRFNSIRRVADKYAELDTGAALEWATTLTDER
ncbi:MAG: hypothetical protein ACI9DF_000258 [Verrucomicrobiales bacterium]